MADFEDVFWSFRIPASEEDIKNARKAEILMKFMGEFAVQRSAICWGDDGRVYWNDRLLEPVGLTIFLPL